MSWVKENYGKAILLAVSLLLMASSGLLIVRSLAFREVFAQVESTTPQGNRMPDLPVDPVRVAIQALREPAQWTRGSGSLFVSRPYVEDNGRLIDPTDPDSEPLYPPVPNQWIVDNELDFQDVNVLAGDPDEDKFTNLQEWEHKTDPNDVDSTPPRYLLLRLKEARQVPNRIVFTSYTDQVVTINTLDLRQPTQFLEVGEVIRGTKFKVAKLEPKTREIPIGASVLEKDVSEVTLEQVETGETFVLVKENITDLGEGFVLLKYLWDDSEIRLKRNEEFALKPEKERKYRYTQMRDGKAVVVEIATNREILVPPEEQVAAPSQSEP